MAMRNRHNFPGFTFVELMVTTLAALVVILGAAMVVANAHQGYRRLFNRVNSEVVRNGYEARLIFDGIVRKSSAEFDHILSPSNLYVYYYEASLAGGGVDRDGLRALIQPNKFAHFYLVSVGTDVQLRLDRGSVPDTADLTSAVPPAGMVVESSGTILAHNVASCAFQKRAPGDPGISMVLTLDNETNPKPGAMQIETSRMSVSTTAIRHSRKRSY